MKTLTIISLLLGINLLRAYEAPAEQPVKLTLASCEGYYVGESRFPRGNIAKEPGRFLRDKNGEPVDFLVFIQNTSTNTIGIYRQWNSWGYGSLQFVVEHPDGASHLVKRAPRAFSMNFPDLFELQPGRIHAVPISVSAKEWKGSEVLREKGVRIKAVFKQEPLGNHYRQHDKWRDVQVFTNRVESAFVPYIML